MAQPVPRELIQFIKSGSKFIAAGHKEPDGDCVGSELALCSALRRLGSEAIPCSAGPFKRTEIMSYAPYFTAAPGEKERDGAKVIVVDCSKAGRTGDLAPYIEGLPLAIIDHHATGDHPENRAETPVFLDPAAPSLSFMILEIIEALGLNPTKEEARLLFFGLCTDTGFFRHVDESGAETFEGAAKMIRAGASPKETFLAINGGKSLDSRILMGHILSRAESFFDGRLILSFEEYEDTRRFGLEGRDSDSLYQLLQSVSGVEAIVIIRQESPENCTVGLRSRDRIDVGAIAASFGGGGHKNAAGLSIKGVISDVKPGIIEAFGKVFR
ncbi:MAG: bifunctional oligoribonuclease/PAP phosphatase NrnA [Treponema sp.]|jgi:phosphoesterase RecJ-like protein|nr:bifunctional oligoribonuclease/PAP phosphatase NrnA [Treponema sp.]